jgi:hypothetical protein
MAAASGLAPPRDATLRRYERRRGMIGDATPQCGRVPRLEERRAPHERVSHHEGVSHHERVSHPQRKRFVRRDRLISSRTVNPP